jgi:hypothetical protein
MGTIGVPVLASAHAHTPWLKSTFFSCEMCTPCEHKFEASFHDLYAHLISGNGSKGGGGDGGDGGGDGSGGGDGVDGGGGDGGGGDGAGGNAGLGPLTFSKSPKDPAALVSLSAATFFATVILVSYAHCGRLPSADCSTSASQVFKTADEPTPSQIGSNNAPRNT